MTAQPYRIAVSLLLACGIPLLAWLGADLHWNHWQPLALQQSLANTFHLVILLQCISCGLLMALLRPTAYPLYDQALGLVLLLLLPLPLFSFILLTDAVSLSAMLRAAAFGLAVALCSLGLHALSGFAPRPGRLLVNRGLQVLLIVLVWNYRSSWQSWIVA